MLRLHQKQLELFVIEMRSGAYMSYRVQIDVYGDRDKNREQTEREEKKSDQWVKWIVLAFLTVLFVFYTKEMFTRVLLDRETKVKTELRDNTTIYSLEEGEITMSGQKDRDESARVIHTSKDGQVLSDYTLIFSNPSDWEHSLVTITDPQGKEVYSQQYNGFKKSMVSASEMDGSVPVSKYYGNVAAIAFGKGTRFRGNILLYSLVCLLYLTEIISVRLWKWIFFKYRIKWAVDRDTIPSSAYRLALLISRSAIFILILFLSVRSYLV